MLRTGRVKKHFFRRNGEESRFPDPRPVPWFARCLPRRSLAEPGPNCPNCRNCPKSSRFPPSALARTSLVLWRMEPSPGKAWGCPPHTPGRGESPAPRKNAGAFFRMLCDHRCSVGTVRKAVSRPSPRSMVCALLATAQPGGAGSELSEKFAFPLFLFSSFFIAIFYSGWF